MTTTQPRITWEGRLNQVRDFPDQICLWPLGRELTRLLIGVGQPTERGTISRASISPESSTKVHCCVLHVTKESTWLKHHRRKLTSNLSQIQIGGQRNLQPHRSNLDSLAAFPEASQTYLMSPPGIHSCLFWACLSWSPNFCSRQVGLITHSFPFCALAVTLLLPSWCLLYNLTS